MSKHRCNNAEIFALPIKGLVPDSLAKNICIVYSPLSDNAIILNTDQWTLLKSHIDSGIEVDCSLMEIAKDLLDCDFSKLQDSRIKNKYDFNNITILPNNKCNFSCSFCYSAKGRSTTVLDKEKAFKALDFFITPSTNEKITISILGGGEPLLSWELVKDIILYAENRALQFCKQLQISITTNGSLITDEIILFLKQHNITTVISYEILESIQNLHRGHYSEVKIKIRRMFELGYTPQFNTVITPENVSLLYEIVDTAYKDFPGIKYICTDPVILPELYPSVEALKSYHDSFIEGFFKAKEFGMSLGIKIDCTANISMDCTMTRYCPGEMGITANGLITVCPCISSEKEPHFNDYIYGYVSLDDIVIDDEKLNKLLNEDINSNDRCLNCPMKYNCAGGCMHKNKMLSPEYKAETCRFTYEFGRRYLFNKLNMAIFEEYGQDIKTILENETHQ